MLCTPNVVTLRKLHKVFLLHTSFPSIYTSTSFCFLQNDLITPNPFRVMAYKPIVCIRQLVYFSTMHQSLPVALWTLRILFTSLQSDFPHHSKRPTCPSSSFLSRKIRNTSLSAFCPILISLQVAHYFQNLFHLLHNLKFDFDLFSNQMKSIKQCLKISLSVIYNCRKKCINQFVPCINHS